MMHTKHNLGKAIAAVAMALLMVVQVAPAVALAQQDGDQAVLTIQSSKSVVKGKGWKLTLPKYWRGKVKITKSGTTTYITSKQGKTLAYISEVDSGLVKTLTKSGYSHYVGKKVRLKNGSKAKIYQPAQGTDSFFAKIGKGKYIMVSAWDPRGGDGASSSTLRHMAKMQSFGKSSKYTNSTPVTCLKGIAKRLSY